ncbi:toprim domain-containing protein [Bacillus sp. ISL-53]|nr:toprim domain-containing protein [Bacillus sp. ISL-53]
MYTKEDIKKAETIDIIDFCDQNSIDVQSDNERYYRLVEHDSCVIDRRKNVFYWNSKGKGGNVINFVQEVEETNFMGAMNKLLDENHDYQKNENVEFVVVPYEYSPEKEVEKFDKARDYLINERKIDADLVDDLHDKGLIKQDKYNNVLFLWKDYENIMGCSEQGTIKSEKFKRGTWKSVQKNSTANYGFNVKNGEPKHLKFFESSIDLLSHATLNKKELKDTWLISMEGLKHNTVYNYVLKAKEQLKDTPESVSLCVDNDKAGTAFVDKLSLLEVKRKDGTSYSMKQELPTKGKDWNEQLKLTVKNREESKKRIYKQKQLER